MSRPESRVVGGMNPIQKYMLRLVLFGAGKTIFHKGTICELVETHDQIRRVLPIVNADLSESKVEPFWIPSRPANRKKMKQERIRRQFVGGLRVAFRAPHWRGEPRPSSACKVPCESQFPSASWLTRLVTEYGYDGFAAFAATVRAHNQWMFLSDRRKTVGNKKSSIAAEHPQHPYIPASPSRRTKTGGGFSRDSVLRAVARMRASHKMRMAVYEVVFRRRLPSQIAGKFGVSVRALNKAATRVRKAIRGEDHKPKNGNARKPNVYAASEALVGTP